MKDSKGYNKIDYLGLIGLGIPTIAIFVIIIIQFFHMVNTSQNYSTYHIKKIPTTNEIKAEPEKKIIEPKTQPITPQNLAIYEDNDDYYIPWADKDVFISEYLEKNNIVFPKENQEVTRGNIDFNENNIFINIYDPKSEKLFFYKRDKKEKLSKNVNKKTIVFLYPKKE